MQFSLLRCLSCSSFFRLRRIECHRNKIISPLLRFIQTKHPKKNMPEKQQSNSIFFFLLHHILWRFASKKSQVFFNSLNANAKNHVHAIECHLPHEQSICNHIYGVHYCWLLSAQRLRKTNRVENKFSCWISLWSAARFRENELYSEWERRQLGNFEHSITFNLPWFSFVPSFFLFL